MHLSAIDLNLLVALQALLAERNVTHAAKRVGITQSAMSHALARLRELFDDPLLVRTRQGMTLTAHASGLVRPLQHALAAVEQVMHFTPEFDAANAARTFNIAASDYAQFVILPPLLSRLRDAPGIRLIVHPPPPSEVEALDAGSIDLAIGRGHANEANIYQQTLFTDRLVCVVRAEHPRVKRALTLREYAELDHIAPGGRRGGSVESVFGKHRLSPRVRLTLPEFLAAPWIVSESDLVLTTTERTAAKLEQALALKVVAAPPELPIIKTVHSWHLRHHEDPAHVWLRTLIQKTCSSLPKPQS